MRRDYQSKWRKDERQNYSYPNLACRDLYDWNSHLRNFLMNYQSLTPAQRDQVVFLFADEIFGTDPNDYEYELIGEMVTWRSRLNAEGRMQNVRKPHSIAVNVAVREVPSAFVRVECQRDAEYAIQQIARSVVARLIQVNSVEV